MFVYYKIKLEPSFSWSEKNNLRSSTINIGEEAPETFTMAPFGMKEKAGKN